MSLFKNIINKAWRDLNKIFFRRDILREFQKCVITHFDMPEVLESAHIKSFKSLAKAI
jgi:hypothetical protein